MDTNEKSGPVRSGQLGRAPQNAGTVNRRPMGNRAPKMDGVSAGGRPQRPVPRSGTAGPRAAGQTQEGRPAPNGQSRPNRPAEAPGVEAQPAGTSGKAEIPQRPQRRAPAAQQTAGKRPAAKNPPQRKTAPGDVKKKAGGMGRKQEETGYRPYRRANQKRKAQRASNLRAFFSDQNPVLKWFERVRYHKDSFAEESDLAKQRQARRAEEEEKRRRRQNRFNTPAVIYTQPAAFNRDRLIVQLISVLTVVVALMVGLSIFFKVGKITVTGAEVYQPWSIVEASGISKGENLLTLSRARATSQILANLPYVKKVRIGIKLPDTVNIEVEEGNVAYAIKDDQGGWWLMDSDAKVTEMINNSTANNHTQVLGVTLSSPKVGEIGVATEIVAEEIATEPGEETMATVAPILVTGAERLAVAQQILRALEANDIVGEAASVDVSVVEDIVLQYGTRYQVMLGDSEKLEYKVACMIDAILQMSDYQTGILDVSFTTWENQVALTPFE